MEIPEGKLVRLNRNQYWFGRDKYGRNTERKDIPKGTLFRVISPLKVKFIVPIDERDIIPITVTDYYFEPLA